MVRKGNNKFKTLHKGSELITRVFKGDELIYQDIDALYSFKFTVDTRLNQNGGTGTNKVFKFAFQNVDTSLGNFTYDPVIVDWGDGQTTTTVAPTGGNTQVEVTHTYDTAGVYQIKIVPTVLSGGVPKTGWLSGLRISGVTSGDTDAGYKILSFDKPFPEGSYNVYFGNQIRTAPVRASYNIPVFTNFRNFKSAPDNLFENVAIVPHTGSTYFPGFGNWAFYCGYKTTSANFNCDLAIILKTFLDKIDPDLIASLTDCSSMFNGTFAYSHIRSIPADLFKNIKTTGAKNTSRMFKDTFFLSWDSAAPNLTIPAGLFDSIDTSHVTSAASMFEQTFSGTFADNAGTHGSTVVTVPEGLLPLDFHLATNVNDLFKATFSNFANSAVATIPEHLFDGLDLSKATSLDGVFNGTFNYWSKTTSPIPATLFSNIMFNSNVTSMNSMFQGTFNNYSSSPASNTSLSIPAGLFDNIDMSHVTGVNSMFLSTFEGSFGKSAVAVIPTGFLDFIDTSNVTVFYQMFYGTFAGYAQQSTQSDVVPANLFAHLDTSSGTNLQRLFYRTFATVGRNNPNITIPAGIFSTLDTSSATSIGQMFYETFSYYGQSSTVGTIPANLFSSLNLQNVLSCGGTFYGTFSHYAFENTSGDIPAGLFSTFITPNSTYMNSLFYSTFDACFYKSTVSTIPSGLFSSLTTSNVTDMGAMFYGTFKSYAMFSTVASIPSDLLSYVDTTSTEKFNTTFRDMFSSAFCTSHPVTIPATLFSTIDTSNATNMNAMFASVFNSAAITSVPAGIFGGITVTSQYTDGVFSGAFGCGSPRNGASFDPFPSIVLNDPFDGMSDFSWASASNTAPINNMFATGGHYSRYSWLSGSASTVLQHFNFTPNSDTNMFQSQDQLTDYATINANWK